jgi:hypothetical protein
MEEYSDVVAHDRDGCHFISSREEFFVVLSDRDNKKDLFREFFFSFKSEQKLINAYWPILSVAITSRRLRPTR